MDTASPVRCMKGETSALFLRIRPTMDRPNVPRSVSLRIALASVAAVFVACGPPPLVPLPADLAPLDEENEAPLPSLDAPETFNTVSAHEGDFDWAHGRGYIARPIAYVWNALQDPEVLVDRRMVSEWAVKKDIDPTRSASWSVSNIVHDIFTVNFVIEWRLDTNGGDAVSPDVVAGRARKVAGTSFISLLDDSVVLRAVDDDLTLVELIRHSKTINTGEKENERYIRDVYDTLRERAHGRAFPIWN